MIYPTIIDTYLLGISYFAWFSPFVPEYKEEEEEERAEVSFTIKVAEISFIAKQGVVVQLCSGSFFAEWTSQKNKKPQIATQYNQDEQSPFSSSKQDGLSLTYLCPRYNNYTYYTVSVPQSFFLLMTYFDRFWSLPEEGTWKMQYIALLIFVYLYVEVLTYIVHMFI